MTPGACRSDEVSTRPTYLFANWKMNLSREEAVDLARELTANCVDLPEQLTVALFASHPHLESVGACIGHGRVALGAQDLAEQQPGAFTGAVSAEQLRELSVRWVLIGHSERRHVFGESEALVAGKLRAALRAGLAPLLCVGEDLDQRERGETEEVVVAQLRSAIEGLSPGALRAMAIAYEPVWAIGTGRHADAAEAERVHRLLRTRLREWLGASIEASIPILYGGSVQAQNAGAYFEQPHVDGALVGGASLRAESFLAILEAARRAI